MEVTLSNDTHTAFASSSTSNSSEPMQNIRVEVQVHHASSGSKPALNSITDDNIILAELNNQSFVRNVVVTEKAVLNQLEIIQTASPGSIISDEENQQQNIAPTDSSLNNSFNNEVIEPSLRSVVVIPPPNTDLTGTFAES